MISSNAKSSNAASLAGRDVNIGGLCTNCAQLKTCSYASPVNDTWFCEEYVFEQPEKAIAPDGELRVLNNKKTSRIGLCVNCDLNQECTFPNPPGGVWFCAEYR